MQELFEDIAGHLEVDAGFKVEVQYTGGGCWVLEIPFDGYTFVFGDQAETWGASVYKGAVDDTDPVDFVDTELDSDEEDPTEVAVRITIAIHRFVGLLPKEA